MGRTKSFFSRKRRSNTEETLVGGSNQNAASLEDKLPIPEDDSGDAVLTEVYRGENPVVDIVAVHGLNGDSMKTFTMESGGTKRFWLGDEDMLPRDLSNSRVLTFDYPATVASIMGKTSSDRILHHAHTLVAELVADRELEGASERPIIFICHSLGGIIVKRALVYSAGRTGSKIEHLHSVYVSTYGVMFFGTPHNGTDKAGMARLAQLAVWSLVPSQLVDTDSALLKNLRPNSEVLQNITDNFVPLMKNFRIYFFWEQEKTNMLTKLDYVVDESSAAPILDNTDRAGLRYDHRGMCRFASRSAPGYRLVVASLIRYSKDAPGVISRRWVAEKEMLRSMRRHEARELCDEEEGSSSK